MRAACMRHSPQPSFNMTNTIEDLRALHRSQRAALSRETQAASAVSLWKHLSALPDYQAASKVAAYIAIRGEIDLSGLMEADAGAGKQFYLPVIHDDSMCFAPWSPGQTLQKKQFGLLEPVAELSAMIDVKDLDVVLTPLVVFDDCGNRIGQGGGFYDRAFAHKREHPEAKPVMIGVAHDSQREDALLPQHWDVPLDIIATDAAIYYRQQVQ